MYYKDINELNLVEICVYEYSSNVSTLFVLVTFSACD